MFKKVLLLFIVACLSSCKSTPNIASIRSAETLIKQIKSDDKDLIAITEQAVKTNEHIQRDFN
ncbi:MAG: hypothetical protein GY787_21590, partial [Alteromonadales bacterium]|nr:hypothetical protein [Alteromonadales bacterium]